MANDTPPDTSGAPAAGAGFTVRDAMRVASVTRIVERKPKNPPTQGRWQGGSLPPARFAKSGITGIPAMSGSAMGSATVRLYNSDSSGNLTDSGVDVTAFNISTAAVGNSKFLIVEYVGGVWAVVAESCG